MFSVDTVNRLFLDLFFDDNNGLKFKEGAINIFMGMVSKDGTIDCDADTLGSVIKGIIETKD